MATPEARISPDGTRIAVKYAHDTAGAAFPWQDTLSGGRYTDEHVEDWEPLVPQTALLDSMIKDVERAVDRIREDLASD